MRIENGQEIPKLQDRVRIAQFFRIDSCVIWENPDIQINKREKNKMRDDEEILEIIERNNKLLEAVQKK